MVSKREFNFEPTEFISHRLEMASRLALGLCVRSARVDKYSGIMKTTMVVEAGGAIIG